MTLKRPRIGALALVLWSSLFLLVALNAAFVRRLLESTPGGGIGTVDLTMIATVFVINVLLLSLLAWPRIIKPAFVLVVLVAATTAWFMQSLGAVIDRHAIASVFESDVREAREWLTPGFLLFLATFGLLPALLITFVRVEFQPFLVEVRRRVLVNATLLGLLLVAAIPQTQQLSALLRNHAELRHYANPFAVLHATRGYLKHEWAVPEGPPTPLGTDALVQHPAAAKPLLLMLVVGESARSASFQRNGYPRPTNPRLSTYPLVESFDVHACGTNTATSLPCMFSNLGTEAFDVGAARRSENLLDVLRHAGMHVVWRDNNTGSKHIADRVVERDFAHRDDPRWCTGDSCYDEVLLEGLDAELPRKAADTVMVLHLLGSHGPAYHQRYPREFAVFQPECLTAELAGCTQEQIRNSYDNTIRYTDHVLAEAIDWLAAQSGYRTAMLFMSDHGESTGERGFYLHGAPRFLAPDEQTHVPMLAWWSPDYARSEGLDPTCARRSSARMLNHDVWFHTVLGLADVDTQAYRRRLDVFADCRGRPVAGREPDRPALRAAHPG